ETCQMLLGQKAKDLRVSTYLAMALARTEGFRGILEGLRAQEVLVEGYWEAMHPALRRMRARGNAFQFMVERLTEAAEEQEPTAGDKEAIEGALEVLQSVQAFTMEAMGEDAPVLSRLKKALEAALRKVPKPKPAAPPTPAAPTATASQPSPAATAQAPATASHAATSAPAVAEPQSATDALGSVMTLAGFIHEQAPTNPSAYRLARTVRWDALQEEPNNQQGKTMLEDLAPHRLTYLNNLVEEADWATLLNVAENTFKELPYHFLLGLQRFVVMAMDGLGAPYQAAKEAVLIETAMLLKRIPGLPRLTFMNGLPFADNATQFWIEQTVEPVLASGKGEGGMSEGDDKVLAEQHDEAKKLFAEGKLREALGVLQTGARQDGSPRSRFPRRFYMALLCMQGNQPVIACPMLEDLDQEIERYSLASWEPDLALEVWTHLHRCYELLKGDENAPQDGIDDRARRIFAKICQIDVTRALKTGG
ncbi:MAG TPA: type VI secretion system protein TssA, partial [Rhodothermales bacterium]|nr:type VI secretion system protein TssA [Rhodothermales bacterium]